MKVYKNNNIYRFGDLFFAFHPDGLRWKNERNIILTDPQYKNSILYDYLTNKTKELDYETLKSACQRFIIKNNCTIPEKDELTIHLRLGDRMNHCEHGHEKSDSAFINYLKKFDYSGISKVTILAVINFAGYKENWDNRYDVNREEQSVSRFSSVMNFFTELEMPVSHFSKSIDEDFCYGAFSHNLITTSGGFSELMKKISNARLPDLKV